MDNKISISKFFNLLKQYWSSNPDKTFQEIWLTLIDDSLAIEMGLTSKIQDIILPVDRAYDKLLKLCKENDDIDNFFKNM